jgi:hypothetical protein
MGGGAHEEWRRLLIGGFAFESAPFAGHPLDRRRAEKALALAFAQGVSEGEIFAEARRHLLTVYSQSAVAAMDSQLGRVKDLVATKRPKRKYPRLWLVFWNSTKSPVDNATSALIQAFDPRASETRITHFLTDFYSSSEFSARELAYFATRRKVNPYTARPIVDSNNRLKGYHCGHNPWLEARLCEKIIIQSIENGETQVSWSTDSLKPR